MSRTRPAPPPLSPLNLHQSWTPSSPSPSTTSHQLEESSARMFDAPPTSPRKPFSMAELAAQAIARPRSMEPSWAEREDLAECPPSPTSSCASDEDDYDEGSSPWTQPSSCAMTPSSSAGSFCLPPPRIQPVASTSASSYPPLSPPPTPPKPVLSRTISHTPAPTSNDPWAGAEFSLKLLFTSPSSSSSSSSSNLSPQDEAEQTLPPAFFPSQRISFSPRLRITSANGLAFSSLGGMHLGVTGMCETLDGDGQVKSKRMIADFCIDLSSGLKIWKRDADNARKAAAHRAGRVDDVEDNETRLPPGTYVLPLSMKVPNSERL